MVLKYRKQKKLHGLLVIVIVLSQISEVAGWDWFNYWSYRLFHWIPFYDKLPWAPSRAQIAAYEGRQTYKKILPKPKPSADLYKLWDIVSITQPNENSVEETTRPLDAETYGVESRREFGPFPLKPGADITTHEDMLPQQDPPELLWEVVVSGTVDAFVEPAEEVTAAYEDEVSFLAHPPHPPHPHPDDPRRQFGPFPIDLDHQLLDEDESFKF